MSITTWSDLPDPRDPDAPRGTTCDISGHLRDWKHVVQDHVCREAEQELWEDWVTSSLINELEQLAFMEAPAEAWAPLLERLATAMVGHLQRSLKRPLCILLRERKLDGPPRPRNKCILVLPNGAKMIIGLNKNTNVLVTCFFPDELLDEEPEQRWYMLAKGLIHEFCSADKLGLLRHPAESTLFVKRPTRRLRDNVLFVTGRSWGFETPDGTWHDTLDSDGWLPENAANDPQARLVKRAQDAVSEVSNGSW